MTKQIFLPQCAIIKQQCSVISCNPIFSLFVISLQFCLGLICIFGTVPWPTSWNYIRIGFFMETTSQKGVGRDEWNEKTHQSIIAKYFTLTCGQILFRTRSTGRGKYNTGWNKNNGTIYCKTSYFVAQQAILYNLLRNVPFHHRPSEMKNPEDFFSS